MEKHQILRPRRVGGTPFIKFYRKAVVGVAVATVAIFGLFDLDKTERAVKIWESGIFEESTKNRLIKFRMSAAGPYSTMTDAEDLEIAYAAEQRNSAFDTSFVPENSVGNEIY